MNCFSLSIIPTLLKLFKNNINENNKKKTVLKVLNVKQIKKKEGVRGLPLLYQFPFIRKSLWSGLACLAFTTRAVKPKRFHALFIFPTSFCQGRPRKEVFGRSHERKSERKSLGFSLFIRPFIFPFKPVILFAYSFLILYEKWRCTHYVVYIFQAFFFVFQQCFIFSLFAWCIIGFFSSQELSDAFLYNSVICYNLRKFSKIIPWVFA